MRKGIWPKRSSRYRAELMGKPLQERMAHSQHPVPKRRGRAPLDVPNFKASQEISKSLAMARARPDSVEKAIELSSIALQMDRLGNVALSYNTFGEAVRAARPLPFHVQQDALSHVLSDFRQTGMHTDCYFGLLRLYGLPAMRAPSVD